MTFRHLAVPLVCSGFLVGCGGGGGDSDSPSAPPKPEAFISLAESSLVIKEGEQKTVAVKSAANSDLSASASDGAVTVTLEGDVLTISASEVDRPVTLEVSVTSALSDSEIAETISLYVENSSAEAVTSQIGALLDDRKNLLDLADDYRLYQFFVDFAYLGGIISQQDKASRLSQFDADGAVTYIALDQQIASLGATWRDYQKGNIPDSELQPELDQAEALLFEHGAYGKARLADISEFSEVLAPGFTPADMAFDAKSGLYSRFLSNDQFGSYLDGEYQFSQAFSALASLVRLSPTDSALCKGV